MTVYTPSFRLWQGTPFDPAIANAWGPPLNTNDNLLEAAITGLTQVSIAGLTTYTLTTANGAADQARSFAIVFTGALTANCTVTLPNVARFGWVQNSTTGGFSVILTAGAGSILTIPPTSALSWYYADGANNVSAPSVEFLNSAIFTGMVTFGGIITAAGGITLPNSVYLNALDTGGTPHGILVMDGSNDVNLVNGGGRRTRFVNQAFTVETFGVDDAGNAQVAATLSVGGVAVVRNDGGTYAINITGSSAFASSAGAVAWGNVTGKPYAFNQSTDVGSSPTFTNVGAANGYFVGSIGNNSYFAYNSGNPILSMSPNNYVFYNAGNMTYATTGTHIFSGGIVNINSLTAGPFAGGWGYLPTGATPGPFPPQTVALSLACVSGVLATNFFAQSDERVKSDIVEISPEEAMNFVSRMRPVTYLKEGTSEAGLIAQDIIRAGYGQYVTSYKREGMPGIEYQDGLSIAENTVLQVDKATPTAYLLALCKSLVKRIEELEKR